MIELLILIYGSILWLIFKQFKLVAVNTWTILTALLIGAFAIGFLLVMMNLYQPFTQDARFYAFTTPIMPQVRGRVVEVPVKGSTPLAAGDVLFRMDPTPFKLEVERLRQEITRAEGDREFSRIQLDRVRRVGVGAVSQAEIDRWRSQYQVDTGRIGSLSAELASAQYDLDQTVVRAPTSGYVTQVMLRPGMVVVPMPLRPVMVFVHAEEKVFVGAFAQNALQSIRVGNEAEIAFDGVPGRIFHGKVSQIAPALAEGQLAPQGDIIDFTRPVPAGAVPVVIKVTDDLSGLQLPAGSAAQVTILTKHWHALSILRRILLRMKSWENYLFLPSHR